MEEIEYKLIIDDKEHKGDYGTIDTEGNRFLHFQEKERFIW